jgi:hypothetical protein
VVALQAKAIPRSQDLTDQSLCQEEEPLGGSPLIINATSSSSKGSGSSSSAMPGLRGPKQQQQGGVKGGLVQEVELRGAKRTQELIRQNQHLPLADRVALANEERAKGNEFYRSVGLPLWDLR